MYGQINDTKHAKTFLSHPFSNPLDLSVIHILHYGAYKIKRQAFWRLTSDRGLKISYHAHGIETGNKNLF